MEDKNMSPESKQYIELFWKKILENFASVKVWFFILPFLASTGVMIWIVGSHLSFIQAVLMQLTENKEILAEVIDRMKIIADMFIAWCTFNVSLVGTIVVVREVFKVSKLKAVNEAQKIANGNGNPGESMKEVKMLNI
jgi:hypothetical protein